MEEYNKGAWEELIERCEDTGVDAFEINFSCPHGMPERKMGMAMGQNCDLLEVRHTSNMKPLSRVYGVRTGNGRCPAKTHERQWRVMKGLVLMPQS
jgi:dihydropyrimidine dehydrogenase (NADP+)